MGQRSGNHLATIIAFFIINLVIFFLSMLFMQIDFIDCLLYSLINALWMPYILVPLVQKVTSKRT